MVVADIGNDRVQVFDREGRLVRTLGGTRGDGVGQMDHPNGVAVDGGGRIVVADWGNHRLVVF